MRVGLDENLHALTHVAGKPDSEMCDYLRWTIPSKEK